MVLASPLKILNMEQSCIGRRSIEETQKRAEKGSQLFQMCSCALTLLCSCCIESENNNRVDAKHEREMESKDFNQLFRLCSARWGSVVLNMEQGCTGKRVLEQTWCLCLSSMEICSCELENRSRHAFALVHNFNPGDPFVQLSSEFLFSIKHFRFTVDQAVSGHFELN